MSQCFTLGDVTTVNMTMVKGGVAYNVIPAEMEVSFDLRIPPTVNLQVCRLHSLYFNRIVLCLYYFIALLSIIIFPEKCVHLKYDMVQSWHAFRTGMLRARLIYRWC